MESPRVTLLMAVFNAEAYLQFALDSVLKHQTLHEVEVIAVDDASTDRSLALLNAYAQEDERLQVVHLDENVGQAVARNVALQRARGEFVGMLDADDWLSPDALLKAVALFSADDEVDSIVFQLMEYYEDGREELYPVRCAADAILTGDEAFRLSLDWSLHGLFLTKRDIHLRYPYDTSCRLYSDDNTTRMIYLHSRKVQMCEGVYYYRKHSESSTMGITPSRFLYMDANLSMRNTLLKEGVSQDILDCYEEVRWNNYLGQYFLYNNNLPAFDEQERRQLDKKFSQMYLTFHCPRCKRRLGYIWLPNYRMFLIQERLFFWLRSILRPS